MLAHWMRPCVYFRPDLRALRAAPTTADQFVRRAAEALIAKLGLPVVSFPGGHTGFMSDPQGLRARAREGARRRIGAKVSSPCRTRLLRECQ